ncbi:chemotaxis response regulator protein-glutamate methylesterase [Paenibacillus sp. J5C_2022]|uniref:protein-glutamate methylesterase/protein-glutamine glutaminase n=1 Tax=Paenibacillus sp. J5C2022 TaxID=2977129 RepID=UPI0021D342CE|nr:chemotaxis response regulator protein-glutamate methylesterase [Paenibacillus sp. J5C2022]MCU6707122.1 chemotaxis response regulator protein-glutamate methylesterase [Paenibacillus sp. J5C2022]
MAPHRVLVVDDSAFMRKIISDLISQDSEFTIVATAVNGAEAVSAAAKYRPDIITMDLEMPIMNGIEALGLIMRRTPTPIIMLSGISEANTRETIKALQYGAFDFIRKPTSAASGDIRQVGEVLLDKLRAAVSVKKEPPASATEIQRPTLPQKPLAPRIAAEAPTRHERAAAPQSPATGSKGRKPPAAAAPAKPAPPRKNTAPSAAPTPSKTARPESDRAAAGANASQSTGKAFHHIVAIGTSTGGPRALHEVVSSLPADLPSPVLVVQHMPPKFTRSLAQRLDSFSALRVIEAEDGMKLCRGTVYIAPGGRHLKLSRHGGDYVVQLSDEPARNGHRPSVDVMFESIAPYGELARHAVIMTGMGSDGAKGMKLLADEGAVTTIAESEETCIVYGMPRSAVENGSVQQIVPLHEIASRIVQAVMKA